MIKPRLLSCFLLVGLILSSCSVEVTQPAVTAILPDTPNPVASSQPNAVTTSEIPVTWSSLQLNGRLVYIYGTLTGDTFLLQIQILDLQTGKVTTIFNAPKYSWIYYLTVSPDAQQLIMSYSPPPGDQPVDQNLYILPLDGSQAPRLLFEPPTKEDDYIEVEWSSDGRYLYFTHVNFHITPQPGQVYPLYEIYRMEYPNGQPEKIAEKAYWPRLSPDSSKIVYVTVDLFERGNKLFVANADGSDPQEVVMTGPYIPDIKDAPIFSADGRSILFSAEVPLQSYQPNWFDRLLGVRVAKAHSNVPSDWWTVPLSGGEITRLTNIQALGLFASRSPDNRYLVSYSLESIFVLKPDGSELTRLVPNTQAIPGTVSWIP